MARTRSGSPPSYRHHKPTGQAVCTVRGRDGRRHDHYLGRHGSEESHEAYRRLLAEMNLPAADPAAVPTSGLTVAELLLQYLDHAEAYYRRPDGTQTSEVAEYKRTIRAVRLLYGGTPAAEFSPKKLKCVREEMVAGGLSRGVVNQRVGRVVRMFKWAASEELASAPVYQALAAVSGLQEGRTDARDTAEVEAVQWTVVEQTLPHLNPAVGAMVRLQWLTGMRSGEVCKLRTCDLDRSGPTWLYRPAWHKTRWHGRRRVIGFGPKAQAVLLPFLRPAEPERVLFSPRDFARGSWGKTRLPRETYTTLSYRDVIAKTCGRKGVPHWHPHQLRHAFGTDVRTRFGLDAAQAALGHARADVTEIYAHLDEERVVSLAKEIG